MCNLRTLKAEGYYGINNLKAKDIDVSLNIIILK